MSIFDPAEQLRYRREETAQAADSRHLGPPQNARAIASYEGNYIYGDGRAHLGNVYNYSYYGYDYPAHHSATPDTKLQPAVKSSKTSYKVPFSLDGIPTAPDFVARDTEIKDIESILLSSHNKVRKICVVHGLGGIGKTQLCAHFARKHSTSFSAVIWLDASSKDSLEQSIERCADRILSADQSYQGLVRTSDPSKRADANGSAREPEHTPLWRLNTWLSEDANSQWLLVYDNLDREWRYGDDPLAFDFLHYLPSVDHGNVLINTRLSTIPAKHRFTLGPASQDQALKMLESRAGRPVPDAEPLLRELKGLPLALVQAGSFLGQHRMSATDYLAMYKSQWAQVMTEQNDIRSQEYGERSILTTWAISRDHAAKRDRGAAGLLQLWAYLDSRDIWSDLIGAARCASLDSKLPEWYNDLTCGVLAAFRRAIGVLLNYSLIEVNENGSSWSMHPVLHTWNRHTVMDSSDSEVLLRMSVAAVSTLSDDESLRARLIPHAQSQVQDLEQIKGSHAGHNLSRVACLLSEHKMLLESQRLFERALTIRQMATGDVWTLATMFRLGKVYARQAKFEEAHEVFLRAYKQCDDEFGPVHCYTLSMMAYLGRTCQDQGNLQASEKWFRRALRSAENSIAFGPEHWETISFYDDLGGVYFADSRFDEAETMYKRALHGREKALGPMHPLTHDVAFHLGRLYHYLDQSQAAEEMYSRAFRGRELHFGLKSRLTQKTLQSLGTLYIEDAKYQHAESLYLSTQSQAVVKYGKHDSSTLFVCKELGSLYEMQQRYSEAENMYKQVIRGYQKTVGMKHGDTLEAERHFALFLANSGRLLSALQMFIKCKEHYELFHPDDDEPHCKDEIDTVEQGLHFCREHNVTEHELRDAVLRHGPFMHPKNWMSIKRHLRPDHASDEGSEDEDRTRPKRGVRFRIRSDGYESSVSGVLSDDGYSEVGSLPAAPMSLPHDGPDDIPSYAEYVAESAGRRWAKQEVDVEQPQPIRPRFQAYAESLSTESFLSYDPPVSETNTRASRNPLAHDMEYEVNNRSEKSVPFSQSPSVSRDRPKAATDSLVEPRSSEASKEMESEPHIYEKTHVIEWLATSCHIEGADESDTSGISEAVSGISSYESSEADQQTDPQGHEKTQSETPPILPSEDHRHMMQERDRFEALRDFNGDAPSQRLAKIPEKEVDARAEPFADKRDCQLVEAAADIVPLFKAATSERSPQTHVNEQNPTLSADSQITPSGSIHPQYEPADSESKMTAAMSRAFLNSASPEQPESESVPPSSKCHNQSDYAPSNFLDEAQSNLPSGEEAASGQAAGSPAEARRGEISCGSAVLFLRTAEPRSNLLHQDCKDLAPPEENPPEQTQHARSTRSSSPRTATWRSKDKSGKISKQMSPPRDPGPESRNGDARFKNIGRASPKASSSTKASKRSTNHRKRRRSSQKHKPQQSSCALQ
ncbi:Nephrocystin-3 [Pseudocercospora fuligena]|uniref:Nephrocystin-3 n=1 Tax=Pseudocercospora fuligena TaxID=685502 RepID=A0A8H6RJH7_9PEZI|nr:Nephrocystin-3 [Pseudocercospora fuligena]